MKYLVLGNWKSNGTAEMVSSFAANFKNVEGMDEAGLASGLALPFHLLHLGQNLPGLWVGAQNVSATGEGAYTGEITAGMIQQSGCNFCLVGHSERRALYGETVGDTAQKLQRLLDAGLYPVFCIGETLEEREAGQLEAVLTAQLEPLANLPEGASFAIAYEPVWAIGTGVAASPADAANAHMLVKKIAGSHGFNHVPVLYGGSVKPANASELASQDGIDGFLVGGASLKGEDLGAILSGFHQGKNLGA